MATVTHLSDHRNAVVRHYAHMGEVEGIATLVPGGYSFRSDATGERKLVSYKDPNLILFGLVSDVEAQRAEDENHGGIVAMICNPEWRLSRER